jgi:hypothetical protein
VCNSVKTVIDWRYKSVSVICEIREFSLVAEYSPESKDVSIEADESSLLRSVTRKQLVKANWKDVASVVVICKLCELMTYLLTELNPSSEVANCVATQELPSILRNPKVHHHIHKSPLLVSILSQINPVHIIPSYVSKIQRQRYNYIKVLISRWLFVFAAQPK